MGNRCGKEGKKEGKGKKKEKGREGRIDEQINGRFSHLRAQPKCHLTPGELPFS